MTATPVSTVERKALLSSSELEGSAQMKSSLDAVGLVGGVGRRWRVTANTSPTRRFVLRYKINTFFLHVCFWFWFLEQR